MKKQLALMGAAMLLATVGSRSEASAASVEDALAKPAKLSRQKTRISLPTLQRLRVKKTGISMPTLQRYRVTKRGIAMPTLQRYRAGVRLPRTTMSLKASVRRAMALYRALAARRPPKGLSPTHLAKHRARQKWLRSVQARLRGFASKVQALRKPGSAAPVSSSSLHAKLRAFVLKLRKNRFMRPMTMQGKMAARAHQTLMSIINSMR